MIALLEDCTLSLLTIIAPPHDEIKLILLNPLQFKGTPWDLKGIVNNTDQPMQWPPKEKMETSHVIIPNMYQCQIDSLGDAALMNIDLPMTF
jgi:hypothetical protein